MENANSQIIQAQLENGYAEAEEILNDPDAIEEFLQKLEKKLKVVPYVGGALSNVPVLASLVRKYVKKEYTNIPVGSIVAVLSSLVYFVSPIDLIPDMIPGIGLIDDAAVIGACLLLVQTDLDEYIAWREANGLTPEARV